MQPDSAGAIYAFPPQFKHGMISLNEAIAIRVAWCDLPGNAVPGSVSAACLILQQPLQGLKYTR